MPKAAFAALVLVAFAAGAHAAPADARAVAAPAGDEALPHVQLTLSALIEHPVEVRVVGNGMLVANAPVQEVLLARIGTDGKLETACVATAEAARRFLAPRIQDPAPASGNEK